MRAADPSRPLGPALRQIAIDRIDDAIDVVRELRPGRPPDEGLVHRARLRCKQVRSLAALVDDGASGRFAAAAGRGARDGARLLAPSRDREVLVATARAVRAATSGPDRRWATRVLEHLLADEDGSAAALDATAIERCDATFIEVRRAIALWQPPDGVEAVEAGLASTYRSVRRGARRIAADRDDVDVHRWRRPVKDLAFQLRVLEAAAPGLIRPLRITFADVGELLGDHHDRTVLREHLREHRRELGGKHAVRPVVRTARHQQRTALARAEHLILPAVAESAGRFVDRIGAYWTLAAARGPAS